MHLGLGKVDSHRLGRDLGILTDGLESAAIGGIDEQDDEEDAEAAGNDDRG